MRAYRLTAWQGEAVLADVPEPEPGLAQVVVRIGGAGVCHSDLHLIHDIPEGRLPWGPPFTLGHENAGWVEAVGSGVTGCQVGDPVAVYGAWGCGRCARCRVGMENHCEHQAGRPLGGGLGLDGGMAPLLLVPDARLLVPIGDLDPTIAAPLTDAGLTSYHAVKRSLELLVPGSHAVVIGVGGLGHMAVQILECLTPTTVIAVDRRAEAVAMAITLGAEHGVEAGPDAAQAIREISRGRGADLVLDMVGSAESLTLGAAVARSLGQLSIVGVAGGTYPVGQSTIAYEVAVSSSYWGSQSELVEVVSLAQSGAVRPHVETFTLEQVSHAYAAMGDGTLLGRAVIVP